MTTAADEHETVEAARRRIDEAQAEIMEIRARHGVPLGESLLAHLAACDCEPGR